MSMRFDLLQQRPGDPEPVALDGVPGWGVWQKSEPGRPGLIVTKRVEQLATAASYRAVVRFRWYSKTRRLLRSTSRTTTACEQPDVRPDLVPARLTVTSRDAATATYAIAVRNQGRGPAAGFAVVFTVGDRQLAPIAVSPLAPRESGVASIIGPRCTPGSTVTAAVDAGGAVDEIDEADDVSVMPCPLAE
jgi:hypothetical protein